MVTVHLHDIVTDADRQAVLALRRAPGQERYLGSMESHFEDAVEDARACPRMWSVHDGDQLVGFVMISDDIPAETLAADDDIVGPYYLWRLLIDAAFQGRGYGRATIDAIVDYVRSKPNGQVLLTSCKAGSGSPQPFYLHYGFTKTDEVKWGEDLLSLDLSSDRTLVTLRPVDDANREALAALAVRPDQTHFVATVAKSYADAAADPDSHPRMWGIYAGDEPVGFVMLSDGAEPTEAEPDRWPYGLWRLLIDARHQRRGYGRAALDLIVDYVANRPDATELFTSAVPGDGSPLPFYEGYGFGRTGEIDEGEVVLRLRLTADRRAR